MEVEIAPREIAMKIKEPLVSIVIVNHNGKKFLKRCFDSLYSLNYPTSKIEIIMVDNCSRDGSIDYVRKNYPRIKLIENDVNNYCKANNLGIKQAKGEYIALINNDTKAEEDWLVELIKMIGKNDSVGAVGSKILFMDGKIQSVGHEEHPNFYWVDRGFQDKDRGQYDRVREVPSICGCSILYRKKCLEDVGLFDEDFNMYLEDVDMSIRCRKKGWKLLICPSSAIYHKLHGTVENEPRARLQQEKNRLLLIAKHWPDKLPEAIAGREYFIKNLDYEKEKDICNIIAFVYSKLITTHNIEVVSRVSPRLFAALRRIFHSERDFFVQSLNAEQEKLSALREESREKEKQIEDLRNKLEVELRVAQTRKQQLEEQKREHGKHIGKITQELENINKEATKKEAELAKVFQQLEERRRAEEELQTHINTLTQELEQEKRVSREQEAEIAQLGQERLNERQQLKESIQQRENLLAEHREQIEQKQTELQGIYNSTGFRFLLKPLWSLLWSIKQIFNRFFHKLINLRLLVNKKLPAFPRRLFRPVKRILERVKFIPFKAGQISSRIDRIKNTIFLRKNTTRAYLNHIHNNTFPLMPKKLTLMLTSLCNLKCEFCDIPERNYQKKELSKDEAIKIINSAAKLGIEYLEITGGEPFLHKDLFEVIDYAHSKEIKINITTNGLLIKENLTRIAKSKINHISISIDGLEKTHDQLRNQQGTYKRTLEGIELLKEQCRNVKISINFVVTNKNVYELKQAFDYFKAKNINVSFFPVINKPKLYLSSAKEKKAYLAFVKKLKRAGKISFWQYVYYINALNYFKDSQTKIRCLGLVQEVAVNVEGNIFPCCVWKNESVPFGYLGNVFREDLEQLWFSDKFHQARKNIFKSGCRNCYDPGICKFSKITGMSFLLKSPTEFKKIFPYKLNYLEIKKNKKPLHVHIRLTSRCNLTCRHCDIWKDNHKRRIDKELNCEQWKGVIDKIYNWLGPLRLDFAGGEIFLRKDVIDIIRYSAEKRFIVGLTTNAFLIDEDKAKQIVDSGLSVINISLDGIIPATHNYIRNNPEAFLKAKNAIDYIRKYRRQNKIPTICISPVIMERNLDELLGLVSLIKDDKTTKINFQAIDHNFGARWDRSWYKKSSFWPKESAKVEKIIDDLIAMKRKGARINNSEVQLDTMKKYFKHPFEYSKKMQCTTADKNIIVDEFGNTLLCWNMAPIGNILNGSLDNIWNSRLVYERRQEIKGCTRTCRILNCNFHKSEF